MKKKDDNCCIVCIIKREEPFWSVINISECGPGTNFEESSELVKRSLVHAGFDEVMLQETANWRAGGGKKFNLEKNTVINIP